jgi:EAL and modified HD-GYP domain-containing signal transduction protein
MLQNMAADKPDEVFRLSLLRSRFGEYIAEHSAFRQRKDEVSLLCLFSMLDVILDSTMEEALQGLAISEDIIDALVDGTGVFKPLCMLLQSYENGDWCAVDQYAQTIQVSPESLTNGYYLAIEWASVIMDVYK